MAYYNHYDQQVGAPVPDWKGARMPERTTLAGRYCTLEPLNADAHAAALLAAYQDNGIACGRATLADWLQRQQQLGWLRALDVAQTSDLLLAMTMAEPLRQISACWRRVATSAIASPRPLHWCCPA